MTFTRHFFPELHRVFFNLPVPHSVHCFPYTQIPDKGTAIVFPDQSHLNDTIMPLFLHFISSMPGCWLLPTLLLHQLLFYLSDCQCHCICHYVINQTWISLTIAMYRPDCCCIYDVWTASGIPDLKLTAYSSYHAPSHKYWIWNNCRKRKSSKPPVSRVCP